MDHKINNQFSLRSEIYSIYKVCGWENKYFLSTYVVWRSVNIKLKHCISDERHIHIIIMIMIIIISVSSSYLEFSVFYGHMITGVLTTSIYYKGTSICVTRMEHTIWRRCNVKLIVYHSYSCFLKCTLNEHFNQD